MTSPEKVPHRPRGLPIALAVALLGVVVLAGLLPNTGVVSASSNCTYGSCPASSSFPIWEVSAAAIVAVLALIVGLLLLRRRRRRPPEGETGEAGTAGAASTTGWSEQGDESSSQDWTESSASSGGSGNAGEGEATDDGTGNPPA